MSLTCTQRAVHACTRVLVHIPSGTPVEPLALVRGTGLPVHAPLVIRRLVEGHWIRRDATGTWVRGGRPALRRQHARGA